MAIKSHTYIDGFYWVWTRCGSSTDRYYESFGYKIPKTLDSKGRLSSNREAKILVKIEHLKIGSDAKVIKVCDDCGLCMEDQYYGNIIKSRRKGDGKDRCNCCSNIKKAIFRKDNIKYTKSLEYFAMNNDREYLLREFSNKNIKLPIDISSKTNDEYLWNCFNCFSEYSMKTVDRTSGNNSCPYCRGMRVNHTNSLWATNHKVASLLKDKIRGNEVTAKSSKRENFICPNCTFEIKNKRIADVTTYGLSCPRCSDGLSYPEKIMFNVLSQLHIEFETHKVFHWSKNIKNNKNIKPNSTKIYDFYIPFFGLIIETHGGQHYTETLTFDRSKSLIEEQENDNLKNKLATDSGIKKYIVIDCRKSELEFIKSNILNSELEEMFSLSKIDWDQCHEYACNSLVKVVCSLWSEKNNIKNIVNITHLCKSTVTKYLKQGARIGWCNYDPEEELRNKRGNPRLSVVRLTLNGGYIDEFISIKDASRRLSIDSSRISDVCKSKRKSAGGFRFMFTNDYLEQYKKEVCS